MFAGALKQLAQHGEPINQVLEIDLDGEDATFTFYALPSDLKDGVALGTVMKDYNFCNSTRDKCYQKNAILASPLASAELKNEARANDLTEADIDTWQNQDNLN